MTTRSIHRLQFLLLGLYIAAAIALWPGLPERVPMRFDFAGNVTDWARTSIFSWFGLPAFAVMVTLLLHGTGRLAERTPELWNIPGKKRFLALTPGQRAPIHEYMLRIVAWIGLFTTLVFVLVHAEVYLSAIGQRISPPWITMGLVLAIVALLLVIAFRMSARAGEMVRRAEEEQG